LIVLDHQNISLTVPLLQACIEKNIILTACNKKHLPVGLWLPLEGHTQSGGRMRSQIEATKPFKKKLWQLTIGAKVKNQALVLKSYGLPYKSLITAASKIRSGDSSNIEASSAAYYWRQLFKENTKFRRDRFGEMPNPILNYIYAIIRAQVAKSLIGSGLFPLFGIHHKNMYNSLCLADDIMEPFRPFVDEIVYNLSIKYPDAKELTLDMKKALLELLAEDTEYPKIKRPLMVGLSQTTSSLARCFCGEDKKIIYPELG